MELTLTQALIAYNNLVNLTECADLWQLETPNELLVSYVAKQYIKKVKWKDTEIFIADMEDIVKYAMDTLGIDLLNNNAYAEDYE